MAARLHVLVGAGGVGKTTLAAGYALALARAGAKVGLLGVDPAKRLETALGLSLPDVAVRVPGPDALWAALLRPADCMRRWAQEACPDPAIQARLLGNAFFLAMADRLAGASDLLAAVRMAEWPEQQPELTDLVVDTAPGLNAVEFLRKPQLLTAFLKGRLVTWLRLLGEHRDGAGGRLLRQGARVVGGLAKIGGTKMLLELADFLVLVKSLLGQMMERLARAEAWLQHPSTEILLVTAVRDDAPATVAQLREALGQVHLDATRVLVNRTLPEELPAELERVDLSGLHASEAAVVRYAVGVAQAQARLVAALTGQRLRVGRVPAMSGLDGESRLAELTRLGAHLLEGSG